MWTAKKSVPGHQHDGEPQIIMLEEGIIRDEEDILALEQRIKILEDAYRFKMEILGEMTDSEPEIDEEEESEEEEESVQSETSTDIYLGTRRPVELFYEQREAWEDQSINTMKDGRLVYLLKPNNKGGPFGRKRKKPKKVSMLLRVTEDEEKIELVNPDGKTAPKSFPMDTLSFTYGKVSDLFKEGLKDPAWNCFTIRSTPHKGTRRVTDMDFVCETADTIISIAVALDNLDERRETSLDKWTRARFYWKRCVMKLQRQEDKLSGIVEEYEHFLMGSDSDASSMSSMSSGEDTEVSESEVSETEVSEDEGTAIKLDAQTEASAMSEMSDSITLSSASITVSSMAESSSVVVSDSSLRSSGK